MRDELGEIGRIHVIECWGSSLLNAPDEKKTNPLHLIESAYKSHLDKGIWKALI